MRDDGIKDGARLRYDLTAAGEQAEVGIDLCRRFVEVAGADIGVAFDAAALTAFCEYQLAVHLQSGDAVDDAHPRALEDVGVFDVLPLVEAREQLHDDGDALAVFRRPDEGVYHLGMLRRPVKGDGDAFHLRVDRRLAQEVYHMVEGVVGEVEHHVALRGRLEDAGEGRDRGVAHRRRQLLFEARTDAREFHEIALEMIASAGVERGAELQGQLGYDQ